MVSDRPAIVESMFASLGWRRPLTGGLSGFDLKLVSGGTGGGSDALEWSCDGYPSRDFS